jgi:hypothetical protein
MPAVYDDKEPPRRDESRPTEGPNEINVTERPSVDRSTAGAKPAKLGVYDRPAAARGAGIRRFPMWAIGLATAVAVAVLSLLLFRHGDAPPRTGEAVEPLARTVAFTAIPPAAIGRSAVAGGPREGARA